MFEHSLGAANREQALALLDELAPIGELMAEQYLALSPDDAAVFQAVLHNVGLVEAYAELLAPVQARRPEVITIYDRLTHPAARALFYLDLTSSALGSLGDVVMVVNILSMLGPGTQAWAPIGMTAKIAIAVIRVVLDSIVPTDLVALEGQTQPWLYSNEGAQWLYWGTFEPQNGLGGTVQSIIEQAASIALPTKLKVDAEVKAMLGEVGEKVFKDVMTRIATRFPSLVARWTLTFDSARLDRVKLIVNMQAYDLTIGDLAQLVPLFGASLASIRWLIDFEVVSPYSLEAVDSWAEDAAIEIEYSTDTFGIDGIAWPQGAKETNFQVKATGYAWRNQNVILLSVPWPQWQELAVPVRVMKQPEGQNMHIAYEAFVVTHGTPGATSEDAIWSSAPTARSVRMRFFDEHHEYEGLATFEVLVNGSSLGGFVLPDGDWTESNIAMSPGLNTVTIRATRGHSGPHTYPFAMSLTVPESTNVEKRREIGLQVGGTFEFQVYVPPAFPSQ
jgi:hypothetical protein